MRRLCSAYDNLQCALVAWTRLHREKHSWHDSSIPLPAAYAVSVCGVALVAIVLYRSIPHLV